MPVDDDDAYARVQAAVMAHTFILGELLSDIARTTPDPHAYLTGMFDRVINRLEQRPLEQQGEFDTNFRHTVEAIIRAADR